MSIAQETYRELSGRTRRLLTDSFSACWSPDGTKIACSLGVYGYSGVAIYDPKTEKTNLLIVPGKDPSWSPDGRHIAFVRDCEVLRLSEYTTAERMNQRRPYETEEVWVMNADGTEPRRLARGGGWPSWSMDARHVYYQSRADNTVYLISIENSEAIPVPVFACASALPSVSPDEKYVAYVEGGAMTFVNLARQSRVAEWAMCMPMWGGNWAPDGSEFAFGGTSQYVEARAGLWIYDLEEEEARQILTGQITSAAWSLDRTQLLLSMGPPYYETWVADLDPNLSTAEGLGPARTRKEILLEWIEAANQELAVDPNLLLTHWVRTAAALWIGDNRQSRYLEEMSQAIDRLPDQADLCHWAAMGTFARPAVNRKVLPLTLLMARKAVEQKPVYARDFAFAFYDAGRYEEAARFWRISESAAPDGSCQYDRASDTYRLLGFGMDIWGKLDDFHFAYAILRGNGSITARIDNIENVNEWVKAGVMIRATLESDSPNVMLLVTPGGVVSFQHRRRPSELTEQNSTPPRSIQPPLWLRLTRQDNQFTGQYSSDGIVWIDMQDPSGKLATVEIPMDETVYVGLAANSRDVTKTAEARLSHVTTTGAVDPRGPFTRSLDIPQRFPPVSASHGNSR